MYTLAVSIGASVRANERAYAALLEDIQEGLLAPGTVIGEVEQADRIGVSRTPMREAISKLLAGGLLRQQSPRVLVVSGFEVQDIRDLFVARGALEEAAVRLAAAQADPKVFARLADSFDAAAPVSSDLETDSYYALIGSFDRALDLACNNEYLIQALSIVRTHLVRARRLSRDNRARLSVSAAEHALIARAIAQGNADLAVHATHVHLHNALTSILASIESTHGGRTPGPKGTT